MTFLLRGYQKTLQKWPVAVQAVQAGALMGVGDVIAQTVVEKQVYSRIDWKRTALFASVGFVIVGPPLRIWYGVLDRLISPQARFVAVKKTAMDQLMFAPFFQGIVISSIGVVQGKSFAELKQRLTQDYKDVLVANYKVWPIVQLCNFYLVPLQYQVLTVQFVAVFWNTYLSWKTNSNLNEPLRVEKDES